VKIGIVGYSGRTDAENIAKAALLVAGTATAVAGCTAGLGMVAAGASVGSATAANAGFLVGAAVGATAGGGIKFRILNEKFSH
jgi:hypothetical protein